MITELDVLSYSSLLDMFENFAALTFFQTDLRRPTLTLCCLPGMHDLNQSISIGIGCEAKFT